MDPAQFHAPDAGKVIVASTGYAAFVPARLPPDIHFDTQLALALSRADGALGELSGLGRHLPSPHLLIAPYIRREAVLSSRIEGTRATLSDLFQPAQLGNFDGPFDDPLRCVVRGAAALLHLTRRIEEQYDVCITPDGPRGPRYRLHPGALLLAQRAQVPLMPFLIEYSRCWRLKAWDGVAIPKPFSRVTVTLLPLVTVPPDLSPQAFECVRARVEAAMVERMVMQ